jgi:hypothetical protein
MWFTICDPDVLEDPLQNHFSHVPHFTTQLSSDTPQYKQQCSGRSTPCGEDIIRATLAKKKYFKREEKQNYKPLFNFVSSERLRQTISSSKVLPQIFPVSR